MNKMTVSESIRTIFHNRDEQVGKRPLELTVSRTKNGGISISKTMFGPRGGIMWQEKVFLLANEWKLILEAANNEVQETP